MEKKLSSSRKNSAILVMILLAAAVLRLWQIGMYPPMLAQMSFPYRLVSAGLGIAVVLLVYLLSGHIIRSRRTALFSAWITAVMPWAVEQGRIYSEAGNTTALLLLLIIGLGWYRKALRLIFLPLFPLMLFFIYPHLWFFQKQIMPAFSATAVHMFQLLSADFFFFSNPSFWWGGMREWGILYGVFLPWLIIGLYVSIRERYLFLLVWIVSCFLLAAMSPFFPETREAYLAVPAIAIVLGLGVRTSMTWTTLPRRIFCVLMCLIVVYEMAQWLHFYTIHLPLQVKSNAQSISQPY